MGQISLRIDDEKKQDWQDAVEQNNEYDSLTHLIELAVHHELKDDWVLLSQVNAFAEGIEFDTTELTTSIDEIFNEVRSVRDQMDQIEAVSEVMQREELRDVALEVNDVLPSIAGPSELDDRPENPAAPLNPRKTGHPVDIRFEIIEETDDIEDVSLADIQFALDFLTYQYNNVEAVEIDGEWRYYEVDKTMGMSE